MNVQSFFLIFLVLCAAECKQVTKEKIKAKQPVISSSDNSRTSLDWEGVYRGNLSCSDCEAIRTEVRLSSDLTFQLTQKHLGKDFGIYNQKGSFEWDDTGGKITLFIDDGRKENYWFKVVENQLIKLNAPDQNIEAPLGEMNSLVKVGFDKEIIQKYWKLIELNGQEITGNENQDKEPYFLLKTDDGHVVGNGGCNSFQSSYKLSDGYRIRFSRIASTRMACPGVDFENTFFKVLEQVDNYSLKGDTLSLNRARMAPLAKFKFVYFN